MLTAFILLIGLDLVRDQGIPKKKAAINDWITEFFSMLAGFGVVLSSGLTLVVSSSPLP
jgi:hypothetical protein